MNDEFEYEHTLSSESFYPVLTNMLSYLNARTLCLAAQVCKSWNRAVKTELGRRLGWYSCLISTTEACNEIDELTMSPSLCVKLSNFLKESKFLLPKDCKIMTGKIPAIIGTETPGKASIERNSETGDVTLLSLTTSNGLGYTSFAIGKKDFKAVVKNKTSFFDFVEADKSTIHNPVVFLLTCEVKRKGVKAIIDALEKELPAENIILMGGRCEEISYESDNDIQVAGFILYGNIKPYLEVYSGNSEKELKDIFLDVRKRLHSSNNKPKMHYCLMLMISCVGRGQYTYGKENVECDIIQQVFPGLKVFGFFGFGEIAYDSSNEFLRKSYSLSYTSVFCLIQKLS